jgi:hypothetical protein
MQQALSKQRKQQFRSDIVEVDSSVRSENENLMLTKDTSVYPLFLVVIYIFLRLPPLSADDVHSHEGTISRNKLKGSRCLMLYSPVEWRNQITS